MGLILLVDDDSLARRLIASALGSAGHQVVHAVSGKDALAQAASRVPDLVVTDVKMPEMDGWALVRNLRTAKATALIPVIFLTSHDSSENRLHGFNLGADDFISKECVVEEIQTRVQIALKRSQQVRNEADSVGRRSGFMGDLAIIGLASLLTMFEMERRSGELVLQRGEEEMRIGLRAGRIVCASAKGSPELAGEECVYQALVWSNGQFFLASGTIDGPDLIGMSMCQLLLEGARRADEPGPT